MAAGEIGVAGLVTLALFVTFTMCFTCVLYASPRRRAVSAGWLKRRRHHRRRRSSLSGQHQRGHPGALRKGGDDAYDPIALEQVEESMNLGSKYRALQSVERATERRLALLMGKHGDEIVALEEGERRVQDLEAQLRLTRKKVLEEGDEGAVRRVLNSRGEEMFHERWSAPGPAGESLSEAVLAEVAEDVPYAREWNVAELPPRAAPVAVVPRLQL